MRGDSTNKNPQVKPVGEILTHWGRNKMSAISQTTFSNTFSWMKMYDFHLRFHRNLFLRFELTIFQHCFRWWLGADQATSHYLNQWWLVYWCMYASLGLNELIKAKTFSFHWLIEAWWCHMYVKCLCNRLVACLVPSHYLNQRWTTVSWTHRKKRWWNMNQHSNIFTEKNAC